MSTELTQFAPAQRATRAVLEAQSHYFVKVWHFGTALHAVPDMVMALNPQRQIVYANQALLDLADAKDLAGIVGKRPGELVRCEHADETEGGCGTSASCASCGAVNAILASQTGRSDVRTWRITSKGGSERAFKVWASPLSHDGTLYTLLAVGDTRDHKRCLF